MMPRTIHGLSAMACISAMQKCIRRNLELEAMRFAVELHLTSKSYSSMVCNRLEVISHEDIDTTAAPWIVPFVATATAQARAWYKPEKLGRSLMPIGNSIRMMARAPKSRQGDHFQASTRLAAQLEHYIPTIPDWALDQHTFEGRKLGRGLKYFRDESTRLVPAPAEPDPYSAEAYRLWALDKGEDLDE
ncbi:MAG: hypothetical protein WDZ66_03980 [Steroidobacteraceae bacterium]